MSRLYTYLPAENTAAVDGILSTALSHDGWLKYRERTRSDTRRAVLSALDSWHPGFRRSYGVSVLREPIPADAPKEFRQFAESRRLYSFDFDDLVRRGVIRKIVGTNTRGRGVHDLKRPSSMPIKWKTKRRGSFLFSNVPHYIVETSDGVIPAEFIRKEHVDGKGDGLHPSVVEGSGTVKAVLPDAPGYRRIVVGRDGS